MEKWKKKIQDSINRINLYFSESRTVISDSNLSLVEGICICGMFGIGLLMVVATYLLDDWQISVGHFAFLPFFIVYYFCAKYLRKHREEKISNKFYRLNQMMVITFMCIFMALVIYIEVVPYKNNVATLVTPAMILLPVIFTIPLPATLAFLALSYVVFCVLSSYNLQMSTVIANAFNGLVGVIFGFWVAWIVTNLRAREEHVKQDIIRESQLDQLTGIYNKSTAEQKCFNYLESKREEECALIVIDVDGFKEVNDTFGHQTGDQVLSLLGNVIIKIFRDNDIKGRIGGDEFIVLMKNVSDEEMVIKKMDSFEKAFTKTVNAKLHHRITCSYGALIKHKVYVPYNPLFEEVDKLLYEAKNNGKSRGKVKMLEL